MQHPEQKTNDLLTRDEDRDDEREIARQDVDQDRRSGRKDHEEPDES